MSNQEENKELYRYYDMWIRYNDVYDRWVKAQGLSSNYYLVLEAIYEEPDGCTQKVIGQKTLIPKQTINVVLKDLVKKSYVSMTPMKEDKRNKKIKFTAEGQKYAEKFVLKMREAELRTIQSLGVERMKELNDDLEMFVHIFEKEIGR